MQTHIVTTVDELERLKPEWQSLHARDPWATFYVGYPCVHAWVTAFVGQEATELRIITARHNGELVGIAPLCLRTERVKGGDRRALRWASHGDYLTFLVDPASPASTVVKSLLSTMKDTVAADVVSLGNIPAAGSLAATLFASPDNHRFTLHVESPIIDLTGYQDFADFESTAVPAKTRKYRNKLLREHDVRWQVFPGSDASVLSRMGELHIREKQHLAGEQGRGERHSLFEDEARRAHVAQLYVPGGDAITFAYTDADGAFLAYRSCYVHRRTLLSWNSAYAPELSDYRLG
ncbi:MAG: GNAT family N-acetyltransferase, partial [Actinobacteria bacterium]|nr:GNAT family N-acetyltransferase [Actinomycetota bacterium]